MSFKSYISTCYPKFWKASNVFEYLSLDNRSLLIKICQAQKIPVDPSSTLHGLTSHEVMIPQQDNRGGFIICPLFDVFSHIGLSPEHPIQSAIIIDLLRCTMCSAADVTDFKEKGWVKEIQLSESPNTSSFDFQYFFDPSIDTPPHPLVPHNKRVQVQIFNTFRMFRERLYQYKPLHFSRYTHKNMSQSTRDHYTKITGDPLIGVGVFGQDDWIRFYHETDIMLEGDIEMRQKWYPSNAKPRTYFAQGGTVYEKSRFLQDFFTTLVNIFPSTHHVTRLQPNRLRIRKMDDEFGHYLIYDLSSFTSNMQAQRDFCRCLQEFFKEVPVEIFDERYGVLDTTYGDLLAEYNEHCVDHPILRQNRVPQHLQTNSNAYDHKCASMLGVYGNLMTCTIAHFLIVANTTEDPYKENNTAGDDGCLHFFLCTYFSVLIAIQLVGIFAIDKTFKSNEQSAVALKRPITEDDDVPYPNLITLPNVVPPNLMVSTSYLLGYEIDSRYTLFYETTDNMPTAQRISVVGKDLLRFLESAQSINCLDPILYDTFDGFERLVKRITGHQPIPGGTVDGLSYVWPVNPRNYAFLLHDPFLVYCLYVTHENEEFAERDDLPLKPKALVSVGDVVRGNSDKWVKLMETLGYIEKSERKVLLSGYDVVNRLYMLFRKKHLLDPVVYDFVVLKDIPNHLVM